MYSQVGVEIFSSYTCRTHSNTNYTAENVLQATHINFICPMRYDSFPLDTQVAKGLKMASIRLCITVQLYTVCTKKLHYFFQRKTNSNKYRGGGELTLFSDVQVPSWFLLLWYDQDALHPIQQGPTFVPSEIFQVIIHMQVQGYVKTTHSVVLDYAVDVHVLNDEDLQLSYGELGNFRLLVACSNLYLL